MSILEFNTIEKHWEEATLLANEFYRDKELDLATPYYSRALFYSELMLRQADEAKKFNLSIASPFFVSCLNLANNLWGLGKIEEAGKYFFYNIWHLKKLSLEKNIGEDLCFEATKNWEKAVSALLDFYEETNQTLSIDFWDAKTYEQIAEMRNLLIINKAKMN